MGKKIIGVISAVAIVALIVAVSANRAAHRRQGSPQCDTAAQVVPLLQTPAEIMPDTLPVAVLSDSLPD